MLVCMFKTLKHYKNNIEFLIEFIENRNYLPLSESDKQVQRMIRTKLRNREGRVMILNKYERIMIALIVVKKYIVVKEQIM